jgi:hypothetical protein
MSEEGQTGQHSRAPTTDVTQSFSADYEVKFLLSKAEGDRHLKKQAKSWQNL